jgi:hypothetical protein
VSPLPTLRNLCRRSSTRCSTPHYLSGSPRAPDPATSCPRFVIHVTSAGDPLRAALHLYLSGSPRAPDPTASCPRFLRRATSAGDPLRTSLHLATSQVNLAYKPWQSPLRHTQDPIPNITATTDLTTPIDLSPNSHIPINAGSHPY